MSARRRVAVIGGGTAGHMAAAHLSRFHPEVEVVFIFDAANRTIGVGEGTTPAFAAWLEAVSGGAPLHELQARTSLTLKRGILYEGWSTEGEARFPHTFWGKAGYHISASQIVTELARYIRAERIDENARELRGAGDGVEVVLAERTLRFDYVLDARGFPPELERRGLALTGIPTNRALLRRGPALHAAWGTRSIARRHGWVFVIPLTTHTTYGLVHNDGISTAAEVEVDLQALLDDEGVVGEPERRMVPFPSFADPTWIDGRVFKLGNRSYFMEPLEATALHALLVQLTIVDDVLRGVLSVIDEGRASDTVSWGNRAFYRFIRRVEHFVSWHYAAASPHDTPFWRHARSCFASLDADAQRFDELLALAQRELDRGYRYEGRGLGDQIELGRAPTEFGPYPLKSIIETGLGLGLLSGKTRAEVFGGLHTGVFEEVYGDGPLSRPPAIALGPPR